MYTLVLLLHSWIRWIAIVAGFGATLAAANTARSANSRAERWGLALMVALDIQLLLGLLLYLVLSPVIARARENFGEAMRNSQLRFWAVEHIGAMVIAVSLAHAAHVAARKANTPESKRAWRLVCFGIATFLMLFGTPWPGSSSGRPLFRF